MPNDRVPAGAPGLPVDPFPHRTLKRVSVRSADGSVEIVTIEQLLAAPPAAADNLRIQATNFFKGDPNGFDVGCLNCGAPVYVSHARRAGVSEAFFAHRPDPDAEPCAWRDDHDGASIDELRQQQYQGRQESRRHELLCEAVATMARRDPRHLESKVDAYRRNERGEGWRFPDVLLRFEGLGGFVIEVQCSRTWMPEIAGRHADYARDGVRLIWVVPEFDPTQPLPRHVRDICGYHRGNIFVLDDAAFAAARDRGTVALTVYVRTADGRFEPPQTITLDDLTLPEGGCPYFKDGETGPLRTEFEARRAPWVAYFEGLHDRRDALLEDTPERRALIVGFRVGHATDNGQRCSDDVLVDIAAVLFAVFAAARGAPRVYVTGLANYKSLLNTLLGHRPHLRRCATLFERLIAQSPLRSALSGPLGRHLDDAKTRPGESQADYNDDETALFRYLVPEIFDSIVRRLLVDRGMTPIWAKPDGDVAR